ncbi:hypothetical protein RIF29_17758 [Crotalaria pallida]|uniref:non-specific serine/threonine protein kinase n=1 Tax=Crotalaria pallida TaxID=3830 RepID=A0AAN9FNI5_CROPI
MMVLRPFCSDPGSTKSPSKIQHNSNSFKQKADLQTSTPDVDKSISNNLKSFTFNDLKVATKKFRKENLIGEGVFGFVYKGWIDENTYAPAKPGTGVIVAVKKLKPESFQGHKQWLAEVNYLGRFHHQNLVKLIGYCSDGKNRLLVYEFMEKGSLENHLFGSVQPISWVTRMNIAIDVAKGVAFLHTLHPKVTYGDLKASNILLNSDFNAKLSDFGFTRDSGDSTHAAGGHNGLRHSYVAPEYLATGRLTRRSDVYIFGATLLELLTGRRIVEDERRGFSEETLVDWAKPLLSDSARVLEIIDSRLGDQYSKKEAQTASALALQCLNANPKNGPLMVDVVAALEALKSECDATKHPSHSIKSFENSN